MIKTLSLFHVQDSDRPMWIIAENYGAAVERWREQIAKENPKDDCSDDHPDGVSLIASGTDLEDIPEILLPTDLTDLEREIRRKCFLLRRQHERARERVF